MNPLFQHGILQRNYRKMRHFSYNSFVKFSTYYIYTERSHDVKFDKGTIYIVYFHTHVHVHIEKMGNLSNSKIELYICDNKLRSCAQFAPRGKCAPGCSFAPPNLHHLQRWSKLAPGCKSAPECIFIKHRLHDQNTSQVQTYTPGVYLHRGVYLCI